MSFKGSEKGQEFGPMICWFFPDQNVIQMDNHETWQSRHYSFKNRYYWFQIESQFVIVTIPCTAVEQARTGSDSTFENVLLFPFTHRASAALQALPFGSLWSHHCHTAVDSLAPQRHGSLCCMSLFSYSLLFFPPWSEASSHLPLPQVVLNWLPPWQEITRTRWNLSFCD